MKVLELMTAPARACAATDNLHTAAEIMWQTDCGCVPVTDQDRHPIGMITDRDIAMMAHLEGEPLRSCTVRSAMSSTVHSCRAEDPLEEAAAIMRSHGLRRLPVIDAEQRLVGIISLNDLALASAGTNGHDGEALTADEMVTTLAA